MTLTATDLKTVFDAFNRHDVDGVMRFFAEDCVFNAVGGPEVLRHPDPRRRGDRRRLQRRVEGDAGCRMGRPQPFRFSGDRGVSEWTFSGTAADGSRIEAEGCDLFTFENGKIVRKQAFRKNRPVLQPRY
jgi:ketosteroid isomerase-like protein